MLKKLGISLSICIFILLSACVQRNDMKPTLTGQTVAKTAAQHEDKPSSSYKQNGKKYHVIHSGKNYEAKGVASWYGHRFNKKRTSSGERFNMYHMTAAHKTLPLSTYVQVTNLRNGKKVIVKVNDRGPFVSNRLIDLSYAAAKKLGMVGRGVAPVAVKAVKV